MKKIENMTLKELAGHADALVRNQTELLIRIVGNTEPKEGKEFFAREYSPKRTESRLDRVS